MEGWESRSLGDVCEFVRGPFGGSLTKSCFRPSGFAVYEQQHAIYNQFNDIRYFIDEEKFREMQRFELRPGDLIMSCSGTMGKAAIAPEGIGPGIINQALLKLRPRKDISVEFLKLWMDSPNFQAALALLSRGVAIKNVASVKILKEIRIALPPVPEQQRIVAILDEAFAGLATATANAEKNLKSARELFESYLNSVFTKRAEGWIDKSLRDVSIEFGRGKSRHRPRNDPALYNGNYPFIQTGDIRNADHVIVEYSQTYNHKGLAQSKLWPRGTICITIAANIAETGILGFDACFPDSVIGMVVDPAQTNNKFVEYLLRFFKAVLQAQGKGSAQDNINLATFENRRFPFPPVKVQNELVERLDAMAEQTRRLEASYEARLHFISDLKQSILQTAFAGELISPSAQPVKEAAE